MKKLMFLIVALMLAGCSGYNNPVLGSPTPTLAPPAATSAPVINTDTPVPTDVPPTDTPVPPATATSAPSWDFVAPQGPADLPVKLLDSIQYVKPVDGCSAPNDANGTCSTRIGQSTDADFTLKAMNGIRLTGDETVILQNGMPLTQNFSSDVKHVDWIVINKSKNDLQLHMTAPDGSFRGYFVAFWNDNEITNMIDLSIYQFLVADNPLPTPAAVNPTAVPNCGPDDHTPTSACHESNVNIAFWNGTSWTFVVGFYNEDNAPYWQQQ